jgi:hypothetical protein
MAIAEANETNRVDLAVGTLFGLAALACGTVAFFAGLTDNAHAGQWELAALLLALSAGAVALDELRPSPRALDAWLSTILRGAALAVGSVGLILGLSNTGNAAIWQVAGIVLGILALATKIGSLESQVANRGPDGFKTLGAMMGMLALALGGVGFAYGLESRPHATTWLYAGVICSVLALSSAIAAEHRALPRQPQP